MFYHLPPVGNPVNLQPQGNVAALFASYPTVFYASGTAALAASLMAVIDADKSRKSRATAEVILPAYACPDLISAVVFAGAKPVLVDLQADRPWLDLTQLALLINENTVAVIAVNLFGIAERWQALSALTKKAGIVLIEDSAQYFPGEMKQGEAAADDWHGDMVVLSFGRGKPVSLLGGGAVLSRNEALFEQLPKPASHTVSIRQHLTFSIKVKLYNAMISPYLYWFPRALPFLHLGETNYHVLPAMEGIDTLRLALLPVNISNYQQDVKARQRCAKISSILDTMSDIINLPAVCEVPDTRRLLRYPLLLKADLRDRIYQALEQAGLGASIMYPSSLPNIKGLAHILGKQKVFPNAEAFASQLIALPTHANVSDKNIDKMRRILETGVNWSNGSC
jgi:dTDP-4-amino-4,6-dideoxygalactose transaminase